MSIRITKTAYFQGSPATLLDGGTQATVSFFCKIDAAPSFSVGLQAAYAFGFDYSVASSTTVGVDLFLTGGGTTSRAAVSMTLGALYHVVMTADTGGICYAYVNAIPYRMTPNLTGAINGDLGNGLQVGDPTDSSNSDATFRDLALWRGWVPTSQDIADLMLGNVTPDALGHSAAFRVYWPLTTAGKNPGDTVVLGDAGLKDASGLNQTSLAFNSLVPGSGTIKYGAAMPFVPAANVSMSTSTNGTSIYVICRDLAGNWVQEGQYISDPVITCSSINGGSPYSLADPGVTKIRDVYHRGMLFVLPDGWKISAGDTVTATLPLSAYNTNVGITNAFSGTVRNCVGKSAYGNDQADLARTLAMGLVIDPPGYFANVPLAHEKNYVKRMAPGSFSGAWYVNGPTNLPAPSSIFTVGEPPGSTLNGVDSTPWNGYPIGLWAARWDDTGDYANHPTTVDLFNGIDAVSERVDLRNPGTAGAGQVRVFDIQLPSDGSVLNISGHLKQDQSVAHIANWAIYEPGDFTYTDGQPTVIPAPTQGDPTAMMQLRMPKCGAVRWVDNTEATWSLTDPEQIQPGSDFAYQGFRFNFNDACTQIRPLDPSVSVYYFNHIMGTLYNCTLAPGQALDAPAAGTQQQIHISDASVTPTVGGTGPIFLSQTLFNGAEKLRVLAIDATDGTLVTVERGSCGTTPQSLAAGSTLQVGYRTRAGTTLDDWVRPGASPGVQYAEFVTQGRHHIRGGMGPFLDTAGWPIAVACSDGSQFFVSGNSEISYVTGPTTFVRLFGGINGSNPNVTVAGTTSLTPSTCLARNSIPYNSSAPYQAQCRVTEGLDGDHVVPIPPLASEACIRAIAAIYRDNTRAGSKKYIEIANEPWNGAVYSRPAGLFYDMLDRAIGVHESWPNIASSIVLFTGQIGAIFKEIFGAVGRAGEIYTTINTASGNTSPGIVLSLTGAMNLAKAHGVAIDVFWYSWYINMVDDFGLNAWLHTRDLETLNDVLINQVATFSTPQAYTSYPNDSSGASVYPIAFGDYGGSEGMQTQADNWTAANAAWAAANLTDGKVLTGIYELGPNIILKGRFMFTDTVQDASGITSGSTTVTVSNGAKFRVGMYLVIGTWTTADDPTGSHDFAYHPTRSEWVKVTGISGNVLSIARGQGISTAKSHANGQWIRSDYIERSRDAMYHPSARQFEIELYASAQRAKAAVACYHSLHFDYNAYFSIHWGLYKTEQQMPGVGDGSDGLANNALYQSRPGPGQKAQNVNQDYHCCSPRGLGLRQWQLAVGAAPPPSGSPRRVVRALHRRHRGL